MYEKTVIKNLPNNSPIHYNKIWVAVDKVIQKF